MSQQNGTTKWHTQAIKYKYVHIRVFVLGSSLYTDNFEYNKAVYNAGIIS